MNKILIPITVLVFTYLFASQVVFAGGNNISTMANIMMHLNHYPSDSEKQTLKGIVDNASATAHEKTMAQAMINLEHKAVAADKPKLKSVISDGSASSDAKDLASIILNLSHSPSDGDKTRLKKMIK